MMKNSHKEHDHDHSAGNSGESHSHGGVFGRNSELYFSIICGGLLLFGYIISKSILVSGTIPWIFYAAAYLFGGWYTAMEAVEKIL
ncbi:MAG: heavy metal translocating P-type ATPase, partial [Verrucomicrobiae bacterium]|nr:heavy metal translocating P-type ATPase [Verrucomicrobiae bacterium]